jgi:hypothetical protein
MIALLDDNKVDTSKVYDSRGGVITYRGDKVRDSHEGGYGKISLGRGFEVSSNGSDLRKDAYWVGEAQSRVVVSVAADQLESFQSMIKGVPHEQLGTVTNGAIEVDGMDWGGISYWKDRYDTAIEQLLSGHESEHALSAL